LKKNTATKWIVFAFNRTTNAAKTGDAAQITASVYIDGGGANAVDDTNPAELGHGYYIFDITAAECNGDLVVIDPVSSTADIQVIGVPGAAWTNTLAADLAAVDGVVDSILVDTGTTLDAAIAGIPTVAEFEARSLVAADYTVVADLPAAGATQASVDAIKVVVDDILVDTAAGATQASVDAIKVVVDDILVDTAAIDITAIDAKVDLILADTDELQTDLVDGGRVDLVLDAILLDTGTTLDGKMNVLDGKADDILEDTSTTLDAAITALQENVTDILADTDELQTDWTADGRLDVILDIAAAAGAIDAAAVADAVWDEAMSEHVVAGSAGEALSAAGVAGDPMTAIIPGAYGVGSAGKKLGDMAAEISAILVDTSNTLDGKINVIDGIVDAILVDTGTNIPAAVSAVQADTTDILEDTGTEIPAAIAGLSIPGAAPSAASVADAVWDEVISSGHAVGNSAAVKLMAAAAGLATSVAGLGAVTCNVTVTIDSVPLQDCDVWITSDEAGTTVVAGTLQTNSSGIATFFLDAGTYYVWQQKDGYNFTNPDTLVVT
jgi:hypothetical protein